MQALSLDYVVMVTMTVVLVIGVYQFYFWCQRQFIRPLNTAIKDDRLTIINDGAENIGKYIKRHHIPRVDCAVAVLSFSTLGSNKKQIIIEKMRKALGSERRFLFCRYLPHFEKHLCVFFKKLYETCTLQHSTMYCLCMHKINLLRDGISYTYQNS